MKRTMIILSLLLAACPAPTPEPRPVEDPRPNETGSETESGSESESGDPWFPKLDVSPPYYSDGGESLDG